MVRKRATGNLTREDWLKAALEALEESGIEGVKVLRLSKRLGASRGSFYWHFRDRDDLLQGLLDYWDRWSTDTVFPVLAEAGELEPKERIWLLMESVVLRGLGSYDPVIRTWARYDAKAARVVRAVERKRLRIVETLFREAGFSEEEAAVRARLLAVYLMGNPLMLIRENEKQREKRARARWKLLTSKP